MPLIQRKGAQSSQGFGEFSKKAAAPVYVENVFSTYLYTGNGTTQNIYNGLNLLTAASGTLNFTKPSTISGSTTISYMYSVVFNSNTGLYVAVGNDNNNYPQYSTSTDGINWTNPALMNGSTSTTNMLSVAVNSSGLYVAVGYDLSNAPLYATSSNGSTWTTPARMNGSSAFARIRSVTVNSSGLFVAVGSDGSNAPIYATSSNGSTWTTPALMNGSTASAIMRAVTVNSSGLFVAVGYDGTAPLYATSSNGSTWTTPAKMNSSTVYANMTAITVNSSGLFVAVGIDNNANALYATSSNGSTWTTPAKMNGTSFYSYINAVAVNSSGTFVAVGFDANTYPIYATSSNGSTWTTPTTMGGSTTIAQMYCVTSNSSGGFVSLGYNQPNYLVSSYTTPGSSSGGMVWIKDRTNAYNHSLFDTTRGATKLLQSNTAAASATDSVSLQTFNANGFSLGTGNTSGSQVNTSSDNFVSWTFAKQKYFFDIVTYTGTGSATTIPHNLGSVPGCIIVKRIDTTYDWYVYHTSLGNNQSLFLDNTNAAAISVAWNNTSPTSTVFSVGSGAAVNASGGTYVAYLFASNAGGFGLAGDQNVITCGSFTTDASGNATVNLGYEPQWIVTKLSSGGTGSDSWTLKDNIRGLTVTGGLIENLYANLFQGADASNTQGVGIQATGFVVDSSAFQASTTYIYIAIRRGPMATPTSGTSVFSPITANAAAGTVETTNFVIDSQWKAKRAVTDTLNTSIDDRLRSVSTTGTASGRYLITSGNAPEATTSATTRFWNNTGFQIPTYYASASDIWWNFSRAPGFFDVVCYTGSVSGRYVTVNHNLGVAPEMMISKGRNITDDWLVYHTGLTNAFQSELFLNKNLAINTGANPIWATSSTTAGLASGASVGTTYNYVGYLFATLPGISKVGSYSGTGATQTINCGFTGGARFVLIKRYDTTGDWYVWDTARGMTAGTDPYLLTDSTAAEVNANNVYSTTGGFQIVGTGAGINASGGSYIFLAIA